MRLRSSVTVGCGVAWVQPLAWEPPCATGVALKRKRKKKRKRKTKETKDQSFPVGSGLRIQHCHCSCLGSCVANKKEKKQRIKLSIFPKVTQPISGRGES